MWKSLTISLLLVLAVYASEDEDYDPRIFDYIINDNIYRKCLKLGNDTVKLYNDAMEERDNCIQQSTKSPTTEKELFNYLCSSCLTTWFHSIEVCLGAEEKYLPELLGSYDNYCSLNDGATIKEQLEGILEVKCASPLVMAYYAAQELCIPKLKVKHHKSEPDFIFKPQEVCSDYRSFDKCVREVLPQSCDNDDILKYVPVFLSPYLDWCEEKYPENKTE